MSYDNDKVKELLEAMPTFDIENPDAADFKDHSEEFMAVMRLATEIKDAPKPSFSPAYGTAIGYQQELGWTPVTTVVMLARFIDHVGEGSKLCDFLYQQSKDEHAAGVV